MGTGWSSKRTKVQAPTQTGDRVDVLVAASKSRSASLQIGEVVRNISPVPAVLSGGTDQNSSKLLGESSGKGLTQSSSLNNDNQIKLQKIYVLKNEDMINSGDSNKLKTREVCSDFTSDGGKKVAVSLYWVYVNFWSGTANNMITNEYR